MVGLQARGGTFGAPNLHTCILGQTQDHVDKVVNISIEKRTFSSPQKNNLFKYDLIMKLVTITISIHSFDWTSPRSSGLEFPFGNLARASTTSTTSSEHLGTFLNIWEHLSLDYFFDLF